MQRYGNLAGDSGIRAWRAGADFIEIVFKEGGTYRYDHAVTGRSKVEKMKKLAADGRGLCTYISRYVREAYAARMD